MTIAQPFATLCAVGAKQYETRSWSTNYRGEVAIHAGKGLAPVGGVGGLHELVLRAPFCTALSEAGYVSSALLPFGAIIAVAELATVRRVEADGLPEGPDALWHFDMHPAEIHFGDYRPGRYAWQFVRVRQLTAPVPCRGALRLWSLPRAVAAQVRAQLRERVTA